MAKNNIGLGGHVMQTNVDEALSEIPQNRTLIAGKLSPNTPIKPEVVQGLKTVDDVFEHFAPELNVAYEDREGGTVNETVRFRNLGDFGSQGLTNNSHFLRNLESDNEQYTKIIKQLKSNKVLKQVIESESSKKELVATLKLLIEELNAAN